MIKEPSFSTFLSMFEKYARVVMVVVECRTRKECIISMNDLLTIAEVARILRVDDTTVRRWVKLGVLPAVILPHVNTRQAYRIKRETVEEILGGPLPTSPESDTAA